MSLKQIDPGELDLFIKSMEYIINNPKDHIMQQVFVEDVEVLINSVRRIDRTGLIVSDIMRRLKTIQNLMDRFDELGYTFSNPNKFQLARETVSAYLEKYAHLSLYIETQYGYKERDLSEPKPTREFREGYEEEQYRLGYSTGVKQFNSGKWIPFVDEGRDKSPNIYFAKGIEDAEMKMIGSKRGKWNKPDVNELLAKSILEMCKDRKLNVSQGVGDILKYKTKKGENIAELSKSLIEKESSAKDKLDLIMERVSAGLIVYERKKENEN